jgi:hypothetical protein
MFDASPKDAATQEKRIYIERCFRSLANHQAGESIITEPVADGDS